MRVRLFYGKSVHENAAYYYELAKEARKKIEGLEEAIRQTEEEIKKAEEPEEKKVRVKKREWYGKFHHAFTAQGRLMIGGRDAKQNDIVVARHMDENDLFFHADIQGGSAVVLKGGADASDEELAEAAQFAASFSKAWVNANAAVDVYAVRKEQLSKHVTGGYIPTGAFAIKGERRWFRGTRLALRIGMGKEGLELVPEVSKTSLKDELVLIPSKSGKEKGKLAKSLAKRFKAHPDELLGVLPNGKTTTMRG